jgi:hypothetical protein
MAVARIDVTASDYRRRQLRMLEQHTPEEVQKYATRLQNDQTVLDDELKNLLAMRLDARRPCGDPGAEPALV